jgi:hypothetical protein
MIRGFAAAALMSACAAFAGQADAGKIKIGYVNTFSGPNAFIGNDEKDGFELALDHLGRKMGNLDVQVIYEDDQIKPEVGRQVTEKLLQSDKVDIVTGYNWSNVLLASVKPAVDAKTFIISGNAGPSQLAGEACSPWFFSASWQNDQTPMALGELLNQRNVKKLFVLAPNYAAGKDMAVGVKKTFKGEIVGEEYTRWPGALMTNPSLLVLDEATEGLAPIVREEIWRRLHELKGTGVAILIIDKELDELCALADRHYVIEKGEIVWSGDTAALQADARVQAIYLAV